MGYLLLNIRFLITKEAQDFVKEIGTLVVIKADGACCRQRSSIAQTEKEAAAGIRRIMKDREFGSAGDRIVVEECLVGREVSILAFTDGETVVLW